MKANKDKWIREIEQSLEKDFQYVLHRAEFQEELTTGLLSTLTSSHIIPAKRIWAIAAAFLVLTMFNIYICHNYHNDQTKENLELPDDRYTGYEMKPQSFANIYEL